MNLQKSSYPMIFGLAAICSLPVAAAVVPFSENFDDGVADGFNAGGDYSANILTGTYDLNYAGGSLTRPATVELTNADGAPGVTISTDAEFSTFKGSVGLGAYGGSNNFIGAPFYLLDIAGPGTSAFDVDGELQVRIIEIGGDGGIDTRPVADFSFDENLPFSLSASIVPGASSGSLDISLTLTQGVNSFTTTGTDATGLTGDFFGYRTRTTSSTNGELVGSFDNFSVVAAPEPGILALAGMGAAVIGLRRRRA